jgi:uncharacterized protein (TIGR02217 family)
MSTPWLVDLPGLSWGQKRTPKFNTLVQTSASGLEARLAEMTITRRVWELIYGYLRQTPSQTPTQFEMEQMEGFYNNQYGPLLTFLFRDQFFNTVTNGFIATGDGSTTAFQAIRFMVAGSGETGSGTSYQEPVFCFDTRSAYTYGAYTRPAGVTPQAYVSGSPVSASFNNETGIITLASASGTSGHPITATFSYGFRARFSEDNIDFDNVFAWYNSLKSLKIFETRV